MPGLVGFDTVRGVNGTLDRPGGAIHFEVIDTTPRWGGEAPLADLTRQLAAGIRVPTPLLAPAQSPFVPLGVMEEIHASIPGSEPTVFADVRHGLLCSHGAASGRALRAFLDRRAPAA